MKRFLTLMAIVVTIGATPLLAGTETPQNIVEFSPAPNTAGGWSYNGAGVLSFDQDIVIDTGLGSNYDALVGAHIYLPTFELTGVPNQPYTLTPLGDASITITSPDNSTVYFTGTLGRGDLLTMGTTAGGFTEFTIDITDSFITHEGSTLGSAALAILENLQLPALDFELSFQGGSGPGYYSFAQMLDGGFSGSGGFSGAISVPEPATIALLSLGGLALARKRRTKC